MKVKHIKLAREQLDETLKQFVPLRTISPPRKGWIRAIRDAIGMTGSQLAKRLNVNKQRVSRIERDERLGNVTLKTIRGIAEAMDCVFVYCLVPRDSLQQMVRKQAESAARRRMERTNQTMRLEKQELGDEEKAKAMRDLVLEIVETMPKSLWDEQ